MKDEQTHSPAEADFGSAQIQQALEVLEAVGPWVPGHWSSPYPSPDDFDRAKHVWLHPPDTLPGIDLNVDAQLRLVESFRPFREDISLPITPSPDWRFCNDNPYFANGDALALYAMMRTLRPSRIIEVGSGFSSALMLDVNERFCEGEIEFTFIEPYPDRLYGLLRPEDSERVEILSAPAQDVAPDRFDLLGAGDILFIDSSHVTKMGSDVNYLCFEILPRLRADVRVLVHDIFYPFEYPPQWLEKRRIAWSEAYLLRAFLQFNRSFEISLFCDYLARFHRATVESVYPEMTHGMPGSIWMRRVV